MYVVSNNLLPGIRGVKTRQAPIASPLGLSSNIHQTLPRRRNNDNDILLILPRTIHCVDQVMIFDCRRSQMSAHATSAIELNDESLTAGNNARIGPCRDLAQLYA